MQVAKACLDWAAVGIAFATVAKWLPPFAAFLSIIWLGMQMYDWIQNKRKK